MVGRIKEKRASEMVVCVIRQEGKGAPQDCRPCHNPACSLATLQKLCSATKADVAHRLVASLRVCHRERRVEGRRKTAQTFVFYNTAVGVETNGVMLYVHVGACKQKTNTQENGERILIFFLFFFFHEVFAGNMPASGVLAL